MENNKNLGQVFTPEYIVDRILDEVGFLNNYTVLSNIFEPSFGTGNFLVKIVQRIIDGCKKAGFTNNTIEDIVNDHVYGNEIDKIAYDTAIARLNDVMISNGLNTIEWKNLKRKNTLLIEQKKTYDKYDFIVGNPPYVRPHHMDKKSKISQKNFQFAKGTSDLYVMFFEMCIKQLSDNGKLGFITPNTYFKNTSQKSFRDYLLDNNYLEKIIDFKDTQIFDNVLVYSAITIINKNNDTKSFTYVDESNHCENYKIIINTTGSFKNQKTWFFASEKDMTLINNINQRTHKLKDICNVQFGVSTNKDSVYVSDEIHDVTQQIVEFNGHLVEKSLVRNAIKASTCERKYILFPYEWSNSLSKHIPISEKEMILKYPKAYQYLSAFRETLENRDLEKDALWYQYARSQGLKVNTNKIVLKNIINTTNLNDISMCFIDAPDDTIVYSGLFITAKDKCKLDDIKRIISSDEFKKYCAIKGKNMSGGYVSINAKTILDFGIKSA